MAGYKHHPITKFNPKVHKQAEQYAALKASLSEIGMVDPIVLYQGKIIDGRARYDAMKEIGLEHARHFIEIDGEEEYAIRYMLAKNVMHKQIAQRQRIASIVLAEQYINPSWLSLSEPKLGTKLKNKYGFLWSSFASIAKILVNNPTATQEIVDGVMKYLPSEAQKDRIITGKTELIKTLTSDLKKVKKQLHDKTAIKYIADTVKSAQKDVAIAKMAERAAAAQAANLFIANELLRTQSRQRKAAK